MNQWNEIVFIIEAKVPFLHLTSKTTSYTLPLCTLYIV